MPQKSMSIEFNGLLHIFTVPRNSFALVIRPLEINLPGRVYTVLQVKIIRIFEADAGSM